MGNADGNGPSPIRLGSLLFTLVDPEPGHEVAFNRWYERDHFYAGCMIGPWQFSGARYVATRAEKAVVARGNNPITGFGGRGTYLGLYWVLDGHHDEWNRWAVDQVNALHAAGRMFAHREHVHTALYDRAFVANRDSDGVPVELALDHRYPGLITLIGEHSASVSSADATDRCRQMIAALLKDSPIAQVLHATPRPLLADAPSDVPRSKDDERRFVELFFVDESAVDCWKEWMPKIRSAFEQLDDVTIRWASPFRPTVVGTDRYTDELWE